MEIRRATKFDIKPLVDMLMNYKDQTPVPRFSSCTRERLQEVVTHIIFGAGLAMIAYKDTKPVGMLLGAIDLNIWDNSIRVLKEVCYWVEPEHRGSTAGYRLIKQYSDHAKELHQKGLLTFWTISKMTNSPDLDYSRFGYKKIEETWFQGE